MFKNFLLAFVLLLAAISARACDYETVCVSEGYVTQRYIPPVYAYTACGAMYVAVPARYESYWIPPQYVTRPIYRPVFVAPVYYSYPRPVYYGGYGLFGRRWCGW